MQPAEKEPTPSSTLQALQAIQNAQKALQAGEKTAVRRWAALAAKLAPDRDEPWLLLAAVAAPQASVGYLHQALKINPDSPRARAGLAWALKRAETASRTAETRKTQTSQLAETAPQKPRTAPAPALKPLERSGKPVSSGKKPLKKLQVLFFILLPMALVILLTLAFWSFSPAGLVYASQPPLQATVTSSNRAEVILPKTTATLEPTATATATATLLVSPTPTLTETPTASLTPEATLTSEATPTALPTDSGASLPGAQPSEADQAIPYTGGKSIVVSISEQHLYAYENGNLVFSFVASTGMGNSTRVGTFHVQDKIPNAYGATWNIWMPDWLGIYYSGSLENGIHALPILSNGATLWAGYLGTPISFGCVVLGSDEAQQLYNWAEIGTPVIIQR